MGSLISELLNIHEGKFIVRASIQVGGSTLATGLSAATSIEQAEDQARVRALVVLGIEDRPYATQAQLVNPEPEPARSNRSRLSSPAQSTEFLPLADTTFQNSLDMDWAIADQAARTFQPPEPQQRSWYDSEPDPFRASPPPLRPELSPSQPSTPIRRSLESPRDAHSPGAKAEDRNAIAIAAPVDLSDIIAHTDIELKRLGWNNAQGRRYLEQTYGKRSRQHLSDSELIEFLDYLRIQPAPGKSMP